MPPGGRCRSQQRAAARATEAKKMGGVLRDVNLHDLTVAVQRITEEDDPLDRGPRACATSAVHFVSDQARSPTIPRSLWKAYQSILQVSDLRAQLDRQGRRGDLQARARARRRARGTSPCRRRTSSSPRTAFVTRIFQLQFVQPPRRAGGADQHGLVPAERPRRSSRPGS